MPEPDFARFRPLHAAPGPEEGVGFDPHATRRRWLREGAPRAEGRYVLYWMQMAKRVEANRALREAARRAAELGLPLVVYEGVNHDYPGACRRIHRFILECARDTARALDARGIPYVFRLRRGPNDVRPAVVELIREAALAVVDDFPAFILPGATSAVLSRTRESSVPVLAVDDNGVVPMDAFDRREHAARTFRPKVHRLLADCLHEPTAPELERVPPAAPDLELPASGLEDELRAWDEARIEALLDELPLDQRVPPSPRFTGGREAALAQLDHAVETILPDYGRRQRDPAAVPGTGLSPYLHFGCLSPTEIARAALEAEAPDEEVEAFLEQLVVRRELSFNFCRHTPVDQHVSLEALPGWAQRTLADHAGDEREVVYGFEELEAARTHDPVWNAAQRELLATGVMQNYLRMLWGKQIIRWTASHAEALRTMVALHDRYALDGRNPNTYANVLWCFGLHDRGFGETPVLGKARPMTTRSTRRKFDLAPYFDWVDGWEARLRSRASHGGG